MWSTLRLPHDLLLFGSLRCDTVSWAGEKTNHSLSTSPCQDWDDEWCDRRQELVFIGRHLDEAGATGMLNVDALIFATQAAIRSMLDKCLLTDDEHLGQEVLVLRT